ncbi:MAG: excinuclease ABC subunit UvrC [Clostridiales bacterium]|nr:excinuclease ABC subunit UvrC [Candidatus Scatonaster coprocaballi]
MIGDGTPTFDARLDIVPTDPGVYLMKDASDSVIYVGKAKNLRNRLRSYFGKHPKGNAKVMAMISHVADFEYVVVASELEALLLECNLIKRYQPHYNILLRDDKGFPYVCITMQEEYPRIMKVFRPDKNLQGARYYGPFLSGDLFRALQALRDIFPTKTCRKVLPRDIGKERACLNYHIGRCVGPCQGGVSAAEYRKVMENICMFFEGKYDGILRDLQAQMDEASENLDFERAAVYRDRLQALKAVMAEQNVSFARESDRDAVGFFRDAGEICFRKLELREGRIIGSSTYFLKDDEETEESLLEAFLMQYYPTASNIPKEILVAIDLEDHDTVEAAISEMAGHKVSVHVPQRGDGARLLELADANAKEALRRRILRVGVSNQSIETALKLLKEKLSLRDVPTRIESYDISNLGNDDRCGGMIVFTDGRPDKSAYRLFQIKTVEGQDDYASMREILTRRFTHTGDDKFAKMPDLILADGGMGQVNAIYEVLQELHLEDQVQLAGMVKDRRHQTHGLVNRDGVSINLAEEARDDEEMLALYRMVTAVQNEVHRFAISYQRKLSKKRNLTYSLETIPGIGQAKRKNLMKAFGSIKAISEASIEEIQKVERITAKDAEAIYQHFHQER